MNGATSPPTSSSRSSRDVAAGEADLAWVWTHAFDTLGVNAFRALNAPMLIDSYPLQQAVIASDIPGEMLAELDAVGVTGIAVLADGLREAGRCRASAAVTRRLRRDHLHDRAARTTLADAVVALGANTEVAIADGAHRRADRAARSRDTR